MSKMDFGILIKGMIDMKQLKADIKKHTLTIDFKISTAANKEIKRLEDLAKNLNNAFANIGRVKAPSSGSSSSSSNGQLSDLEIARRVKAQQTLIAQVQNKLNMGNRGGVFGVKNDQYSGSNIKSAYEKVLVDAQALNIQTDNFKKKLVEAQTEVVKLNPAYQSLQKEAQKTLDKTDGFANVISKKLLNALSYRIIFSVFNTINKAVDSWLTKTIEIDTELRNINKVLDLTETQMKDLVYQANELAIGYARTTTEVMQAMAYFAKAGFTYNQMLGLSELSLKLQNVGDLTADMSSQFLIAVNAAYQLNGSLEKLSSTVDLVNNLSNNAAITVEFLSEAMKVAGSVAYSAGLGLEEFTSLLTTVGAATQRSGREVGNGIKTIILRLTQVTDSTGEMEDNISKVEETLRSVGIEIRQTPNTFKPAIETLTELGQKWKDLTDLQQREITYNLAGVYRSNILESFLANVTEYEENLYIALNSVGSATRENELYMTSLEAGIKKVTAAWESFVIKMQSSKLIKGVLEILAFAVKNIDVVFWSLATITLPKFLVRIGMAIISFYKLNISTKLGASGMVAYGTATKSALSATQLWAIGVTAAIAVITLLVGSIRQAKEEQEAAVRTATENTQRLVGEYGQLNIIIKQYETLRKQYEKTGEGVEELKDIQEQLIAQFSKEAIGVDLVNGKYQEQIDILDDLKRRKLDEALKSNESATNISRNYMNENIDNWGSRMSGRTSVHNAMMDLRKYGLNIFSGQGRGIAQDLGLDVKYNEQDAKYSLSRTDMIKYLEEVRKRLSAISSETATKYGTDSKEYQKVIKDVESLEKAYNKIIEDTESHRKQLEEVDKVYRQIAQLDVSGNIASKLQGSEKILYDTFSQQIEATTLEEYTTKFNDLINIFDGINADNIETKWKALVGLIPGLKDVDKNTLLGYITNTNTQISDAISRITAPLDGLEKEVKELEDLEKAEKNLYDLRREIADASGLSGEEYGSFVTGGNSSLLANEKYANLSNELTALNDKYKEDIANSEAEGLNNQETITRLYETQVKLKEKQLSIIKKELEIEERRKNLNRLENERTQATFINGQIVWVADYEAIAKQNEDMLKDQQELDRLKSEKGTDGTLAQKELERLGLQDSITAFRNAISGEDGITAGLQSFSDSIGLVNAKLLEALEKGGLWDLFNLAGVKAPDSPLTVALDDIFNKHKDALGNVFNIKEVVVNSPAHFDGLIREIKQKTIGQND